MSIFIGNEEIGKVSDGTENIAYVHLKITQIFPDNLYSFELCYDSIGGLNGELWTLNRPLRNECMLCKDERELENAPTDLILEEINI